MFPQFFFGLPDDPFPKSPLSFQSSRHIFCLRQAAFENFERQARPRGARGLIRTHIKTHMCCSLGFCLFEKQLLVPFCDPRQCSSLELLGIPWGPLCFGSLGHPVAL